MSMNCPLCGASQSTEFHRDARRSYQRCDSCSLVFVPRQYYLTPEAERAEYLLHQNRVDDPGYRGFLSRLANPLRARLAAESVGLDFGCGPGPALAAMLREAGHRMVLYDPNFANEPHCFTQQYDFITATEVVEHLHQPGRELARLWSCLKAGAWLGVMTKLVRSPQAFSSWHYKNDPTHVCFFSRGTWMWWSEMHKADALEFVGDDVILLRRGQ